MLVSQGAAITLSECYLSSTICIVNSKGKLLLVVIYKGAGAKTTWRYIHYLTDTMGQSSLSFTSKSKNSLHLKKGNIGMANLHKKQRRQDRVGLVRMAR